MVDRPLAPAAACDPEDYHAPPPPHPPTAFPPPPTPRYHPRRGAAPPLLGPLAARPRALGCRGGAGVGCHAAVGLQLAGPLSRFPDAARLARPPGACPPDRLGRGPLGRPVLCPGASAVPLGLPGLGVDGRLAAA